MQPYIAVTLRSDGLLTEVSAVDSDGRHTPIRNMIVRSRGSYAYAIVARHQIVFARTIGQALGIDVESFLPGHSRQWIYGNDRHIYNLNVQ